MLSRGLPTAVLFAVLLAGCGGGSAGAPAALPTASAAPKGNAVATASLTIKFPQGFHTARIPGKTGTSSAARRPAYVNATVNKYLDVWVVDNGSATHVIDSSGGTNISVVGGGSQTLSIPLYSTSQNQIVAYERDQPYNNSGKLLALGETDLGGITAGSAPQVALTMQMNAQYIGVMSDPDDLNADATIGPKFASHSSVCTSGNSGSLYFFAADPTGGFVDAAGAGGVSLPTVTGWSADAGGTGNTFAQGAGVAAASSVTYTTVAGGLTVRLTASNPAYALVSAVLSTNGTYPGLQAIYVNGNDYWFTQNLYGAASTVSNSLDVIASCNVAQIQNVNAGSVSIPSGLDSATSAPASGGSFPVVVLNGYTYYAFSFTDNRVGFGIAKYDINGNYITYTEFDGDRYIGFITNDTVGLSVTFNGQYEEASLGSGVTVPWSSLP